MIELQEGACLDTMCPLGVFCEFCNSPDRNGRKLCFEFIPGDLVEEAYLECLRRKQPHDINTLPNGYCGEDS